RMSSTVLCAVILLACALTFSAAQMSCRGRCGVEYYRGYMCQCDYSCLFYGECCKDYESQCTTKNSCKGRCGETFKRGRLCSCDSDCMKYKQCCPDYKTHCEAEGKTCSTHSVTTLPFSTTPHSPEASVSTELTVGYTTLENSQPITLPASSVADANLIPEATTSNPKPEDATTGPPSDPSSSISPSGPENLSEPDVLTTHTPSYTAVVQGDTTDDVTAQVTTTDLITVTSEVTEPSEATSQPQDKPDIAQLTGLSALRSRNDKNCMKVTHLYVVILQYFFTGHYFWFLGRNKVPGPPRGITQVWGVPSPIDTVFTRCNCQGKTYIFKGTQYWRFENDVLDPGYPQVVATGFDGLQGHITAALSVPQYQRRKESVYFFKRGGSVQKYSYQSGTSPTCGRKVQNGKQWDSLPAISIRMSWRGFPSTITAAVSVPSNEEPEGYKYYIFSRSKSYNVKMEGEHPVIAAPKANAPPQSNDLFKCSKKV
uniref:SMB domain-containing protein n=1 Tax=Monopterus albus TaxID=43700 RepID=A0A3Q3KHA5_MONAL